MKKILFMLTTITLLIGSAGFVLASDYYEFSTFAGSGSEYDVDSYGNDIYYGAGTSVYKVTVSIADLSKKDEPRYLANGDDNPNYQDRIFSNNTAITLTGGGSLASSGTGEMFVDSQYIYTISSSSIGGKVLAFNKTTGAYVSTAVTGSTSDSVSHGWGHDTLLSYGDNKWWLANEHREVYSSSSLDGGAWHYEFTWNNMAGSHGDGMEFVNGFIFVSDMTSNAIGQWQQLSDGSWSKVNQFAYTELVGGNKDLEGMGFGALGHFWAGSGSYIYELGGGEIQDIIDNPAVPEPGTILLLGSGLLGLGLYGRKRKKA